LHCTIEGIFLVFEVKFSNPAFRVHPERMREREAFLLSTAKIGSITRHMSKTVQDTRQLTVIQVHEVAYRLSIGTEIDDLQ